MTNPELVKTNFVRLHTALVVYPHRTPYLGMGMDLGGYWLCILAITWLMRDQPSPNQFMALSLSPSLKHTFMYTYTAKGTGCVLFKMLKIGGLTLKLGGFEAWYGFVPLLFGSLYQDAHQNFADRNLALKTRPQFYLKLTFFVLIISISIVFPTSVTICFGSGSDHTSGHYLQFCIQLRILFRSCHISISFLSFLLKIYFIYSLLSIITNLKLRLQNFVTIL